MTDTWTHASVRALVDKMSDHIGEWQGLPVPLGPDTPLVLAKDHPLRSLYAQLDMGGLVEVDFPDASPVYERVCTSDDVCDEEYVVNEWYSRRRNCRVIVVARGARRYALTIPLAPDRSMDRLTLWLQTIGAADAWDLEAEHRARATLREMLTERQWMHYDLTGSFFETSPRSRLTYLFRRLRPTIAMSPRGKDCREDVMRCIGVLCFHPIGYYARSWAGCMVPTDDVIAHLTYCRGDEAGFWRVANQHAPAAPEAGL